MRTGPDWPLEDDSPPKPQVSMTGSILGKWNWVKKRGAMPQVLGGGAGDFPLALMQESWRTKTFHSWQDQGNNVKVVETTAAFSKPGQPEVGTETGHGLRYQQCGPFMDRMSKEASTGVQKSSCTRHWLEPSVTSPSGFLSISSNV